MDTSVIGFTPVADRPLCHECGARFALRRCEDLLPTASLLSVIASCCDADDVIAIEGAFMAPDGPCDAREFIRQGDSGAV
jgi:hypothetical protein